MSYCYRLVRNDDEIVIAHVHYGIMGMTGKNGLCIMYNKCLVMHNQCLDSLELRLIDMTSAGWRIVGDAYDHPNGFSAMEFIREVKNFSADPRDFSWHDERSLYPMVLGKDGTHWCDLTGVID